MITSGSEKDSHCPFCGPVIYPPRLSPGVIVLILDLKRHNCLYFLQYHKEENLFYCGSKGRKLLKSIKRAQHLAFRQSNDPLAPALWCWGPVGWGVERWDGIPKWLGEGHRGWNPPRVYPSQEPAGKGSPSEGRPLKGHGDNHPIHGWQN